MIVKIVKWERNNAFFPDSKFSVNQYGDIPDNYIKSEQREVDIDKITPEILLKVVADEFSLQRFAEYYWFYDDENIKKKDLDV